MMRRRGSALIETAMFLPLVLSLLIGTVELARVTYTYYQLEKLMYNLARYIGTQQGVNVCDPQDPAIVAGENYALTGTTDSAENPIVPGLAAGWVYSAAGVLRVRGGSVSTTADGEGALWRDVRARPPSSSRWLMRA